MNTRTLEIREQTRLRTKIYREKKKLRDEIKRKVKDLEDFSSVEGDPSLLFNRTKKFKESTELAEQVCNVYSDCSADFSIASSASAVLNPETMTSKPHFEDSNSAEGEPSIIFNKEKISEDFTELFEDVYKVDNVFSEDLSAISNPETITSNSCFKSCDVKNNEDSPVDLNDKEGLDEEYSVYSDSSDSSDSSDFSDSLDSSDLSVPSRDSENDLDNLDIPNFEAPVEIEKLREFGQRINQKDLDILLDILRPNLLPTLPKSSKTFLGTVDARYNIIETDDANDKTGQFVYLGIRKGLEACVNPDLHKDGKILLQINVDGLPLNKSNNNQFWPLTGKVFFEPNIYEVFAIAIYFGPSKPKSVDEYLEDFITEMNELLKNGIIIGGVHFEVELMCLICDTPARAFLKKTLGHKGKESCERCEIIGKTVERRTAFPSMNEIERTDESFRNFRQARHHHGPSALLNISPPVDMIKIFVLDPMHLFLEGATKTIIENLRKGNSKVRLSVTFRKELDRRMEYLTSQIPFEFQRKTRATANIAKWKATELKFFLLYCGPIVLKNLLKEELYNHFLLLHVASRILYSEKFCREYNAHAKAYLRKYFSDLKSLYGPELQTLNAHHLIHANDDVKNMNCNLSKISAFEFESFVGKITRKLRTPNKPLAQVCRRLFEQRSVNCNKKITLPPTLKILSSASNGDIEKIKFKDATISKFPPNNMVLLNNKNIASVNQIILNNGILTLKCQIWKKKDVVYTYPSTSEKFNIGNLYVNPTNTFVYVPISSIACKLVKLQLSFAVNQPEELFVISFLH